MKTILIAAGVALTILVGGVFWSRSLANNDPNAVAMKGIHWHPHLTICVGGRAIEIPQNIGIGSQFAGMRGYDPQMNMAAMHTHDDLPNIHLEFMSGPVYKEDVMLGRFFKIWGKDMRSFGANMRMTVNGKENTEYESYIMHDGDRITLNYD